jgi:hypothetical protein
VSVQNKTKKQQSHGLSIYGHLSPIQGHGRNWGKLYIRRTSKSRVSSLKLVKDYATSREIAGSIPDGITEISN